MPPVNSKFVNSKFLICFDIGTSGTNISFGMPGSSDAMLMLGDGEGAKLPSNALLKRSASGEWEVYSFGYEAFNEHVRHSTDRAFMYIPTFKMVLYGNQLGANPKIKDKNGNIISAIELFTLVMKYLKAKALVKLKEVTSVQYSPEEITWLVTVPAIWSEGAKGLLRKAARAAALWDRDPDQIQFVLEPEAASLHVKYTEKKFTGSKLNDKIIALVDFGGGTTDMVVHKVTEKKLIDVSPASGTDAGGTLVNKAFIKFLQELVGVEAMARLESEDPVDYYDLIWETFEMMKIRNAPTKLIRLPQSLVSSLEQGGLQERVDTYIRNHPEHGPGLSVRNISRLEMTSDFFFEAFLKKVVEKNVKFIRKELNRENVRDRWDYLFVVGGFAACQGLFLELQHEFGSDKVVRPIKPRDAVLSGAIHFGRRLVDIERLSRWTIGVSSLEKFSKRHEGRAVVTTTQRKKKARLVDVFSPFVEVGEPARKKVQIDFNPTVDGQTEMFIDIYQSGHKDVKYIDEPGTIRLAQLVVPMPEKNGLSRKVTVEMFLGETEMGVHVQADSSKEGITARLEFTSNPGVVY
eukprot:gb/GEZN01004689.1/.p1 GENE.gb/GEZN01004689.1/~~gb/GEZN01004689.1/.p1  ORF type:complete len:576 (+),score=65.99 gb/GEZN01004689.1/:135-1862(+)